MYSWYSFCKKHNIIYINRKSSTSSTTNGQASKSACVSFKSVGLLVCDHDSRLFQGRGQNSNSKPARKSCRALQHTRIGIQRGAEYIPYAIKDGEVSKSACMSFKSGWLLMCDHGSRVFQGRGQNSNSIPASKSCRALQHTRIGNQRDAGYNSYVLKNGEASQSAGIAFKSCWLLVCDHDKRFCGRGQINNSRPARKCCRGLQHYKSIPSWRLRWEGCDPVWRWDEHDIDFYCGVFKCGHEYRVH